MNFMNIMDELYESMDIKNPKKEKKIGFNTKL